MPSTDMFHGVIAHGMWGGALISAVLGTELPGPGTIFLNQSLKFEAPVGLGDTVTVRVEVTEKQAKGRLLLACTCLNQHGKMVIEGIAKVIAPREKVRRPRVVLPEVHLHVHGGAICPADRGDRGAGPGADRRGASLRRAVADRRAGCGAQQGMIVPVLVGPKARIDRRGQGGRAQPDGYRDHRRAPQPCRCRDGGGAGARGQGGGADEGRRCIPTS